MQIAFGDAAGFLGNARTHCDPARGGQVGPSEYLEFSWPCLATGLVAHRGKPSVRSYHGCPIDSRVAPMILTAWLHALM